MDSVSSLHNSFIYKMKVYQKTQEAKNIIRYKRSSQQIAHSLIYRSIEKYTLNYEGLRSL